ncbi:MAG: hypothetical protein HC915_13540 [Anaerolineae bacterium]|nr:hypothetical protein [Anaerolineae bacterium]
MRDIAAVGQLPATFVGIGPNPAGLGPDGRGRLGYDVGYTFFVWFTDNFGGLEAHRRYVELVQDVSIGRDEALEMITGLSIQEIETQWRLWLGASGAAPTLLPTITPIFLPTPTPFLIPGSGN